MPMRTTDSYLDVRSPSEFSAGSIPGSTNLPILDDEQRRLVGICYRSKGRDAAIALGHTLVAGEVKAERLAAWCDFARRVPDAEICCARGGLRSQIAAQWLEDAGVRLKRVEGGYKALRNQCLNMLDSVPQTLSLVVIGGRTGSGKTEIIRRIEGAIDLEGIAEHRGSAFGACKRPQPSQATFENHLAYALARFRAGEQVVIEDESRAIGSRSLPPRLYEAMGQAPILVVELDRAARAMRIYDEYVTEAGEAFSWGALRDRYLESLARIKKRLGGVNYVRIAAEIESAFERGERDAHLAWIRSLLETYYDPMYDHGLKRKASRICFRGTPEVVCDWIRSRSDIRATPRTLR